MGSTKATGLDLRNAAPAVASAVTRQGVGGYAQFPLADGAVADRSQPPIDDRRGLRGLLLKDEVWTSDLGSGDARLDPADCFETRRANKSVAGGLQVEDRAVNLI